MDLAGLAALILALSSLYFNYRQRRQDDKTSSEREAHDKRIRTELVLMGQNMAALRADNACMAMLINQLFNQYENATGSKPDIDFEMLRNLQTLQYITGKLGPLDLNSFKEPK